MSAYVHAMTHKLYVTGMDSCNKLRLTLNQHSGVGIARSQGVAMWEQRFELITHTPSLKRRDDAGYRYVRHCIREGLIHYDYLIRQPAAPFPAMWPRYL